MNLKTFWIDLNGQVNHAVKIDELILSYENIMKNYFKRNHYIGTFTIKQYTPEFIFTGTYLMVTAEYVLQHPVLYEIHKKYYPELLI